MGVEPEPPPTQPPGLRSASSTATLTQAGLQQLNPEAAHALASSSAPSLTAVNQWPNRKDDYDLQDAIGVGATATVYKVGAFEVETVLIGRKRTSAEVKPLNV